MLLYHCGTFFHMQLLQIVVWCLLQPDELFFNIRQGGGSKSSANVAFHTGEQRRVCCRLGGSMSVSNVC